MSIYYVKCHSAIHEREKPNEEKLSQSSTCLPFFTFFPLFFFFLPHLFILFYLFLALASISKFRKLSDRKQPAEKRE